MLRAGPSSRPDAARRAARPAARPAPTPPPGSAAPSPPAPSRPGPTAARARAGKEGRAGGRRPRRGRGRPAWGRAPAVAAAATPGRAGPRRAMAEAVRAARARTDTRTRGPGDSPRAPGSAARPGVSVRDGDAATLRGWGAGLARPGAERGGCGTERGRGAGRRPGEAAGTRLAGRARTRAAGGRRGGALRSLRGRRCVRRGCRRTFSAELGPAALTRLSPFRGTETLRHGRPAATCPACPKVTERVGAARRPRPQKRLPPGRGPGRDGGGSGGGLPRVTGLGPARGERGPSGLGEGGLAAPGGASRSRAVGAGAGAGAGGVVTLGLGVLASSLCAWRPRDELRVSGRMGSGARAPKGLGADVALPVAGPRNLPERLPGDLLSEVQPRLGGLLHGRPCASEPQLPAVRRKGSGYMAS